MIERFSLSGGYGWRAVRTTLIALMLGAVCVASVMGAEPEGEEAKKPVVHPFGLGTPGGRGGKILRVTNLKTSGPGSLRAAVEAAGRRIIVFEVGGVIDLEKKHLVIRHPFVTIAGQTAPSPGITLIRGAVQACTHDVVIRHIAMRPGDAGEPPRTGWGPDAFTTNAQGDAQGKVYNIVLDHCSATWGTDEGMSVSGPRNAKGPETTHDVTFRHCIIAEGLYNASHRKGAHSRGSLVMDGCRRIAFIGNLFAHNNQRHPLFKGGSSGIVVNNLIVNPGDRCIQMTSNGHGKHLGAPLTSVVGNVMVPGKNTRTRFFSGTGKTYARDNVVSKRGEKKAAVRELGKKRRIWIDGLEPLPSDQVRESVFKNVGSRPADRDSVDRRIIRQCREGKGRIIDSQKDVGGYPKYGATRRKLDIPEDDVDGWLDRLAAEVEGRATDDSER
jgi:hypothetical protein